MVLVALGSAAILIGGLDLFNGTYFIVPGSGMIALGAYLGQTPGRRFVYCAFLLIAGSQVAILGVSSLLDGVTGWWQVVLALYMMGWLMDIVGVACELTAKLAAAASVMVTLPVGWKDHENPSSPLPFLIIQGVADPFFPWQGGMVNEGPFRKSEYQSAEETVVFWVNNNHAISPPAKANLPDTDPKDSTTVFQEVYSANPEGAEVVFYGINGGGHTWPGSADTGLGFLVGLTSRDISATQVIWEFFKTHTRRS